MLPRSSGLELQTAEEVAVFTRHETGCTLAAEGLGVLKMHAMSIIKNFEHPETMQNSRFRDSS